MDNTIKNKLIKIAYENPELRSDLLDLITKEAGDVTQLQGKALTSPVGTSSFSGGSLASPEGSSALSGGSSHKSLIKGSNNISFVVGQIKQLDHTKSEIDGVMVCKSGTRVNGTIPWKVTVSLGSAFYSNMQMGDTHTLGTGFFKYHSGEAAFRIFKALEKQFAGHPDFSEVMERHGNYSALEDLKTSIEKYLEWVMRLNPQGIKNNSNVTVLPAKPANSLTE